MEEEIKDLCSVSYCFDEKSRAYPKLFKEFILRHSNEMSLDAFNHVAYMALELDNVKLLKFVCEKLHEKNQFELCKTTFIANAVMYHALLCFRYLTQEQNISVGALCHYDIFDKAKEMLNDSIKNG